MKHVYSGAGQISHLFLNQFTVTGERITTMPDHARGGSVQYARLGGYAYGANSPYSNIMELGLRKKLDLTDASVFYSYRTTVALIIPKHKLVVVTSTSHSSFTSRHMPCEYEFPYRPGANAEWNFDGWNFIYAALSDCLGVEHIYDESKPVVDPDTGVQRTPKLRLKKRNPEEVSFTDSRAFNAFSGPVQWRMELIHRAMGHRKSALRARTEWSINSHRANATNCIRQAMIVSKRFGLPEVPPLPDDATLTVKIREATAKRKIANEKMRVAQEKRDAERLAADLAMRAEWVAGTREHISWSANNRTLGTLLRIRGDKVQTSNGTEVSLIGARRAWPVLQMMHRARVAGRVAHIEERADFAASFARCFAPYAFRHLTKEELRIGCTVIPWAEIERIAPEVMLSAPVGDADSPLMVELV